MRLTRMGTIGMVTLVVALGSWESMAHADLEFDCFFVSENLYPFVEHRR